MGKKLTYDYVKKYIESFGYSLLSEEYIAVKYKLKIQCNKGHEYEANFNNFQRGTRCPICNDTRYTYEYVKKYIDDNGYKLLSNEYINNITKIELMCNEGHKYMARFHDFKNNNQRCPVCNKNSQRLSYDYVKLEFKKEGYTLLSQEYKSNNTKLKVMCNKGHIYHVKYNNFKNGTRCPLCSCSKGEDKIRFFLLNNSIDFVHQKTFKGCKLKHLLPFDFYIPHLNLCIEYDGEQHFKPIDFAGKGKKWAEKQFIKCIERDKIKNQYCKNNNIRLIRIPYWNYKSIEKILNRELKIYLKENFND